MAPKSLARALVAAALLLAGGGAVAAPAAAGSAAAPRPRAAEPAAAAPSVPAGSRLGGERFLGLPLAEALGILQREGLRVVFSSAVVLPSMVVRAAPRATDPRAVLDELVRPHGLAVAGGPRGRLVVVRARGAGARPPAGAPAPPVPVASAEILVTTPAGESRHGEPLGTTALVPVPAERDLPHAGADVFRAVGLLAGASTTESSSQLTIRGGRRDDVMVLLDGLELIAPYHLQELDGALGIVPGDSIERVELISDPVPAEYGDRLGGVVDIRTQRPDAPLSLSLGVGSLFAEASASGGFAGERGRWLAAARGGNYRLTLEAGDRHEDPRYWDVFAKGDWAMRSGQELQLRLLLAGDDFGVEPVAVGGGTYRSRWRNSYLWLDHLATLGGDTLVESAVWVGRLERSRLAQEATQGATRFDLDDARELSLTGGKSVWRWSPNGATWSLDGGAEWRQLRSSLDYRAEREALAPPLPGTTPAAGTSSFADDFEFDQLGAFASGRLRAGRGLSLEAGLRWDHTGITDESHLSPRLHLAWSPGPASVVRAGWGWYYQSQRPYELQVEDGETAIWPAERSSQGLLSFERRLAGGASLRVGAWERRESRPRARYESLFDSAVLYPELSPGRVRVEPDAGRARGVELLYRAAPRPRFDWTAAYTLASVADRVDGRWVPRASDEPHALQLAGHYRLPHDWTLSAVWLYHSGWPTTRVEARAVTDEGGGVRVEPVLGPVRAERLPPYHRLDLRLGRGWDLAYGHVSAYVDLQNVYDRDNVRGFDGFRFELDGDGAPAVAADPVSWDGFVPSFGVRWSF